MRGALVGMFKMVARLSDVKLFCSSTSRAPCTPLPVRFSEYSYIQQSYRLISIIHLMYSIMNSKMTWNCMVCVCACACVRAYVHVGLCAHPHPYEFACVDVHNVHTHVY